MILKEQKPVKMLNTGWGQKWGGQGRVLRLMEKLWVEEALLILVDL